MMELTFVTHSTTVDNELGVATGWLPGLLSPAGRDQALALGERYQGLVDVVFSSDLARARETLDIAFSGRPVPKSLDHRLRECNYGGLNGHPVAEVHANRTSHLDVPYPGGESYLDVVARVDSFLRDLTPQWWNGSRVLVIGHSATRYALDHLLGGADLASVLADPGPWREGWTYRVGG